MRHAPSSNFIEASPLPGLAAAPSRFAVLLGRVAILLSLPGRVAAVRRDMALLGRMTPAELSDIGLSRQDVSDAATLPLWQSPGTLLTRRAAERRRAALPRRG
ncbi:DUF1127 domain-containing protein [Lichenihabitans sp. Uapishka_5]|uniref:DUF1127 domain-containing protein n=1 Tax=Lichenihabitans sp. Uapishka_5 TaxID=3037302 RepID=UPI0029E7E75E|nr:DUF1127 domain-containing protein [Lichenihabitans sp. Uapishka_5]MDX7953044.1 DUF1127 domain-containing protein [Lichenihabitans sp. Uapishka_5]